MALEREVNYRFTETGADKVSDALGKADKAAEGAARAGNNAGSAFGNLSGAMQDSLRPIDDNLKGFDALQGRLGQINTAIGLLSGVALFNMVQGFVSAATAMRDWITDAKAAEEAAKAQAEAQAELAARVHETGSAFQALATKAGLASFLIDPENARRFAEAQANIAAAQDARNAALTRQVDIRGEIEAIERRLQATADGLAKANQNANNATAALGANLPTLQALGKEMAALRAESGELDSTIRNARISQALWTGQLKIAEGEALQFAASLAALFESTEDVDGSIRKSTQSLLAFVQELDRAKTVAESLSFIFEGDEFLPGISQAVDDLALGFQNLGEQMSPAFSEFAQGIDSAVREAQRLDDANAAMVQGLEDFAVAQGKATAAQALAGIIAGESAAQVLNAAASSIFQRAQLEALFSLAKAIAEPLLASQHLAAAAAFQGVALAAAGVAAATGGGGGSGGGGGGGSPRSPASDDLPPDRDRATEAGAIIINANFNGQPIHTRTDIQDGIARLLDEGSRRRGRARFDARSFRRRN